MAALMETAATAAAAALTAAVTAPVLANWRVALEAAPDGKGEREESEHCSLICARRAWMCGELRGRAACRCVCWLAVGGARDRKTVGC